MMSEKGMETPESLHFLTHSQSLWGYRSSVPALIVLGGATATGKTGLSLAIARRLGGIILSADSRLVYRELDIGTAKPTLSERSRVPHALIDICDPRQTYTVAEYQHAAQGLIHDLHQTTQSIPLLVGGTGLYIDAVVQGLKIPPVAPQAELRSQLAHLGQAQCYAMLQQIDHVAATRIHPNDVVRTLRALEVAYVTGQPLSAQQGQHPPDYPILYLGLACDAATLEHRIARRTEAMLAQGLVAEVEGLCNRYGTDLPVLKTLGYGEILEYLQGDCSLDVARSRIITHTRQFAKRQCTWFRKRDICWFDCTAPDLLDQVWHAIAEFLAAIHRQNRPLSAQS